jgi:hypothetical protein
MAQVIPGVRERVDFLLDYLTTAWQELPAVEHKIDQWDQLDQIDYIEEWSPKESLLRELSLYAADGVLNNGQRRRYGTLQRMIQRNRPILERLRSS